MKVSLTIHSLSTHEFNSVFAHNSLSIRSLFAHYSGVESALGNFQHSRSNQRAMIDSTFESQDRDESYLRSPSSQQGRGSPDRNRDNRIAELEKELASLKSVRNVSGTELRGTGQSACTRCSLSIHSLLGFAALMSDGSLREAQIARKIAEDRAETLQAQLDRQAATSSTSIGLSAEQQQHNISALQVWPNSVFTGYSWYWCRIS